MDITLILAMASQRMVTLCIVIRLGVSCDGHADVDSRGPLPTEKDLKIFSMADNDVDPFDFSKVDFDSLVVSYSDY